MRKPSGLGVREIARKLNLNISTVSRALNRSYHVSKETTELVLRTANEMGYHKQQTRRCIVILLPSSQVRLAWYTLNLINALKGCLLSRNYYWEFINSDRIDIIQERSVIGIISIDYTGHIAKEISDKYSIPLVCINDAPNPGENIYSVSSDATSSIHLAFDCLFDYGHRNIAFISTSGHSVEAKWREEAFRNTVSKRGLENRCVYVSEAVQVYHGMVHELAAQGITAIIADGETTGLSICKSLNFCKINIPKKMSLITWEIPYVSEMIRPSLTTVEQNFPKLAETAVQMLEAVLRNNPPGGSVTVPYSLHLRDSVTVPRE